MGILAWIFGPSEIELTSPAIGEHLNGEIANKNNFDKDRFERYAKFNAYWTDERMSQLEAEIKAGIEEKSLPVTVQCVTKTDHEGYIQKIVEFTSPAGHTDYFWLADRDGPSFCPKTHNEVLEKASKIIARLAKEK